MGVWLEIWIFTEIAEFSLNCQEWATYITLLNKDFGEWYISTDSTSLGLTDTQMNTRFVPLAQIFPQNGFF